MGVCQHHISCQQSTLYRLISDVGVSCMVLLQDEDKSIKTHGLNMWAGGILLGIWVAVLVVSIVLVNAIPNPPDLLRLWEAFYRTGSIIYGGGQVVLPMLYTDVVQRNCDYNNVCVDAPDTWVTSKQFYAGLGVVQVSVGRQ